MTTATHSAADAFELLRESQEHEAQIEAEQQAHAWRIYVERLDRDDLSRADVQELVGVMEDLGVSEERLAEDRRIVSKAREESQRRADRDAAHKRSIAARDELRALEKRHEAERNEARRKKSKADFYLRQCSEADHNLQMLGRQRPQLFKTDGRNLLEPLAQ